MLFPRALVALSVAALASAQSNPSPSQESALVSLLTHSIYHRHPIEHHTSLIHTHHSFHLDLLQPVRTLVYPFENQILHYLPRLSNSIL